ncbi:MAG: thioredoxin family protein [Ignavibacteria bacterium]|nr:thioredoxin family protein [Ignavibacteria bacterium]
MKRHIVMIVVGLSLAFGQMAAQTKDTTKEASAQREKFDPQRDPEQDLKAAVTLASKSGQRILLDVGGEWCIWCRKLDKFFQDNKDVSEFLHANYIVVKVNWSKENKNEKFLSNYPEVKGYPHLFVLDNKGRLLHSQDTGTLETGDHHDHDKVFDFLKKWAPKKDSEELR